MKGVHTDTLGVRSLQRVSTMVFQLIMKEVISHAHLISATAVEVEAEAEAVLIELEIAVLDIETEIEIEIVAH